MKPESFSHHEAPSYEDNLKQARDQYLSEFTDLLAKIKGSSFKAEDKAEILKQIHALVIVNS